MSQEFYTHGHISPNSSFWEMFENNTVPLKFLNPIYPDREGAPPCYMVDGAKLPPETVKQLGELLLTVWGGSELGTLEKAMEYVREGLPLECEHFAGVSTNTLTMVLLAAPDDCDGSWEEEPEAYYVDLEGNEYPAAPEQVAAYLRELEDDYDD
ncbi:MAG: hypothetical protein SVX43_19445 [Cyanobacteriota bacterium]|nr:hypothetical protein [Cyanobacteriota bacterium]